MESAWIVPTGRLRTYSNEVVTGDLTSYSPEEIFKITESLSYKNGCFAPILWVKPIRDDLIGFGVGRESNDFEIRDVENRLGIEMGLEIIPGRDLHSGLPYLRDNELDTLYNIINSYSNPPNILRSYIIQDNINRSRVVGETEEMYNKRNQSKWLALSHKFTTLSLDIVPMFDRVVGEIFRGGIKHSPDYYSRYSNLLLNLNSIPHFLHEQLKPFGINHLNEVLRTKLSISAQGGKIAPFEALKSLLYLEQQAHLFELTRLLINDTQAAPYWDIGRFKSFTKRLTSYFTLYGMDIGISIDSKFAKKDEVILDPRIFYSTFLLAKSGLDRGVNKSELYLHISGLRDQNKTIQYRETALGENANGTILNFETIIEQFGLTPVSITEDDLSTVIINF